MFFSKLTWYLDCWLSWRISLAKLSWHHNDVTPKGKIHRTKNSSSCFLFRGEINVVNKTSPRWKHVSKNYLKISFRPVPKTNIDPENLPPQTEPLTNPNFQNISRGEVLDFRGVFYQHVRIWSLLSKWAVTKTLVNCCIEGTILPSYMGIVISHSKDPFQTTSIMECQQGFERCSSVFSITTVHIHPQKKYIQKGYHSEGFSSLSEFNKKTRSNILPKILRTIICWSYQRYWICLKILCRFLWSFLSGCVLSKGFVWLVDWRTTSI